MNARHQHLCINGPRRLCSLRVELRAVAAGEAHQVASRVPQAEATSPLVEHDVFAAAAGPPAARTLERECIFASAVVHDQPVALEVQPRRANVDGAPTRREEEPPQDGPHDTRNGDLLLILCTEHPEREPRVLVLPAGP